MEKKNFRLYNIIPILMGVGTIVIFMPVLLFVLVPVAVICCVEFWDDVLLWLLRVYEKTRK